MWLVIGAIALFFIVRAVTKGANAPPTLTSTPTRSIAQATDPHVEQEFIRRMDVERLDRPEARDDAVWEEILEEARLEAVRLQRFDIASLYSAYQRHLAAWRLRRDAVIAALDLRRQNETEDEWIAKVEVTFDQAAAENDLDSAKMLQAYLAELLYRKQLAVLGELRSLRASVEAGIADGTIKPKQHQA